MVHRDFAAWPKALPQAGSSARVLGLWKKLLGTAWVEGSLGGEMMSQGPASTWERLTHSPAPWL